MARGSGVLAFGVVLYVCLFASTGAGAAEFLKIAKRGVFNETPENTIASTLAGIQIADVVEIDVQMTKDGVVVLMHDDTLDRTTNGSGGVSEHTFEQLRQLDAGSYFGRIHKLTRLQLSLFDVRSYFGRWDDVRIPSLRAVVELCHRYSVPLWIDVKQDGTGPAIRAVLEDVGMPLDETYITSGSDERSDALIDALPGILMVRTGPIPESWDASFFEHWRSKGRVGFMASFEGDGLKKVFIDDARAAGMFVVTRFDASAEEIRRTVDSGAAGALSRNIETMVSILPMAGDTNEDKLVDEVDLEVVRTYWHSPVSGGFSEGDFDGNGWVDEADMALLMRKWGVSARDESFTMAFLVFLLLGTAVALTATGLFLRRRRAR